MPTHRPPLLSLALPLLFVALLSGCKEGETTPGGQTPPASGVGGAAAAAGPAKPGFKTETFGGVSFQYPGGWTSAPSEEARGQVVTAPEPDTEWPASIAVGVADDPVSEDLQKEVDEAVERLHRRDKFLLKEKKVVQHPAGFRYGRIEYTSELGTVSLTQWEILAPVAGGKRLVVHANAASEDWPKYQPVFAEIVDSIRLPG